MYLKGPLAQSQHHNQYQINTVNIENLENAKINALTNMNLSM